MTSHGTRRCRFMRLSADGSRISSRSAPAKPRLFSTRLLRRMWRPRDFPPRKPMPNGSPRRPGRRAGCTGHTHEKELKQAKEGVEPYAGWLKQGQGFVVPVSRYTRVGGRASRNTAFMASKDNNEPTTAIDIVVTGGGTNTFWSGGDFGYAGSASVDQWR